MTIRNLLSRSPMTFNELLDLFEAYVASIGGPIRKGHDMLREEIGWGEHDALGHIFGVVDDAEQMAKRLCQIRAARNTGADVTVTLTEIECRQLDTAIPDVIDLLGDAASMLDLLSEGDTDMAASLRLLSRALRGAYQIEVPALLMADHKIRKAAGAVWEAQRQAELQMGEVA